MKEKSVVERQEEVVMLPSSNTPNLDKITGEYNVLPCKKNWLHEMNPDFKSFALFEKSAIWIGAPRRSDIPDAVRTNISKEEQAEFEREMNLQPGTMSPYNLIFWQRHQNMLKVSSTGYRLNCNGNVKHKLFFRLLQANGSKIAFSKEELALNSSAELLVTNALQEAKVSSEKINMKTKAFIKLGGLSLTDKINFLKVYEGGNFKVSDSTTTDLVDQIVGNIADKYPSEFLSTFDNPLYKEYIFVQDLISKNVITRRGGIYSINGGEPFGPAISDIVLKLQKEQDLKIALKAKLENTK